MTLAQRLRDAAATIEELNALCDVPPNHFVTPEYLRSEAYRMEQE